jgi:RNA polymerase sigma-70 factor (ECF subfamily)
MNDRCDNSFHDRLSQISTTWTVLFDAHHGSTSAVSEAQRQLLQRYSSAAYRYLLGAVRDADVADDLFQEFALRLSRGAFKQADPGRGRFRDLLKTVLCNLVIDHRRKQRWQFAPLPESGEPAAVHDEIAEQEQGFVEAWRAELMSRAWDALAAWDKQTGQHLHTVLRFRVDHPDVRSPAMAERLADTIGKPLSAEWVRKRLYLAREKFTDTLLDQVAQSLEAPTPDLLQEELIELGMIDYCRAALRRRTTPTAAKGAPKGC